MNGKSSDVRSTSPELRSSSSLYEKALDLAQRVGPLFGCIMGLCYSGAYASYWFDGHSKGDLAQVFFGLGFAAFALGLGRAVKRATDINVAAQAENRINNPNLSSTSQIPEIQHEIKRQVEGTSQVATNGGAHG